MRSNPIKFSNLYITNLDKILNSDKIQSKKTTILFSFIYVASNHMYSSLKEIYYFQEKTQEYYRKKKTENPNNQMIWRQ